MHAFGAIRREPLQDGGMEANERDANWVKLAVRAMLRRAYLACAQRLLDEAEAVK